MGPERSFQRAATPRVAVSVAAFSWPGGYHCALRDRLSDRRSYWPGAEAHGSLLIQDEVSTAVTPRPSDVLPRSLAASGESPSRNRSPLWQNRNQWPAVFADPSTDLMASTTEPPASSRRLYGRGRLPAAGLATVAATWAATVVG